MKSEREISYDITCMWNQKYNTNEPIDETETDSQAQRTDLWWLMGRELGEGWSRRLGLANVSLYIYVCVCVCV